MPGAAQCASPLSSRGASRATGRTSERSRFRSGATRPSSQCWSASAGISTSGGPPLHTAFALCLCVHAHFVLVDHCSGTTPHRHTHSHTHTSTFCRSRVVFAVKAACPSIDRRAILYSLERMGAARSTLALVKATCERVTVHFFGGDVSIPAFLASAGVTQGCPLSPIQFSLTSEGF